MKMGKYLILGFFILCLFGVMNVNAYTRPTIFGNSVYRTDAETATIRFLSNTEGTAYYKITSTNIVPSDIVTGGTSLSVTANTTTTINLTDLSSGEKYVHIIIKDNANVLSNVLTVAMPYDIYYFDDFEAYQESTNVSALSSQLYIWTGAHGTGSENQKIIIDSENKLLNTSAGMIGVDIRTNFISSITDGYIVYQANVKNSGNHSILQYGALTLGANNTEKRHVLAGIDKNGQFGFFDNTTWKNGEKLATANNIYNEKIVLNVSQKKYDYYVDNEKINTTPINANNYDSINWFGMYNGGGISCYDNIKIYVTDEYFHNIVKGSEINGTFTIDKLSATDGETVRILDILPATNYKLKGIKVLKNSDNSDVTTSVNYSLTNKSFIMPSYEVKINVEFELISYTITFDDVNGVIFDKMSPVLVNSGSTEDITITADTGYRLKSVKVNDVEKIPLTNNKVTIADIEEDKEVVVTVEKIPYTITVNEVTGTTISPNGTINVLYGDDQDITITADLGYRLKSVKVNDIEKLPLTNNKVTISNIEEDKEVEVIVEKIPYTINIKNDIINGTVIVQEKAVAGEEVTLIVAPANGYKLKTITALDRFDEMPAEIINNKFIMPSYNVFIEAEFEKIEYEVTNGNGQTHTIGINEDAIFRIDADKSLFNKVYLNDKELDSKHYEVTEGSTIITLKQDYLDTLKAGTYNLKATFTDGGEANTTFVIANAEVIENTEPNPKTGDGIMYLILFGSISLIGLAGLYLKKNLISKIRYIRKEIL